MTKISVFIFIIFFATRSVLFSQNCDCTPPVEPACLNICFGILQTGTKEQITQTLKISPETAQKIVNAPNRKSKTKIEDFQDVLSHKSYLELESKFSTNIFQSNITGDNVGRDKLTKNYYSINPFTNNSVTDSVKYEIVENNIRVRERLANYMYEGDLLRQRYFTDSSITRLTTERQLWVNDVYTFLKLNLDQSYLIQFILCEDRRSLSNSMLRKELHDNYFDLDSRIKVLNKFISELRSNQMSQLNK